MTVTPILESLEALHIRRHERLGDQASPEGKAAQQAVLQRLTANVRLAEEYGWRSCSVERAEDGGRLSAWGVPPGDVVAYPIPDWSGARG